MRVEIVSGADNILKWWRDRTTSRRKMRTYTRPYVGRSVETGKLVVFRSDVAPAGCFFEKRYTIVTGPFKTVKAARLMASFGQVPGESNPHCTSVYQAERLVKEGVTP